MSSELPWLLLLADVEQLLQEAQPIVPGSSLCSDANLSVGVEEEVLKLPAVFMVGLHFSIAATCP